jgi:hypothetical protein
LRFPRSENAGPRSRLVLNSAVSYAPGPGIVLRESGRSSSAPKENPRVALLLKQLPLRSGERFSLPN